MGAIGDWVNEEIIEPIVDFVGDVVSEIPFVGDFLEDVVDFAYEEIHGTIHAVSQWTYDLVPADVKMYAATIAAVAFPPVWWLPAVVAAANAADEVKAAGGSDADMFKAAFKQGAITLATTKAGSYAGKYVGSATAGAGKIVSAVAAGAASGATRGALTAALTDGDIGDAALKGAVVGAVAGGVSAAGAELSGPDSLAPSDSLTDMDAVSTDWEQTASDLTVAFNRSVEGFKELPPAVQDMLVAAGTSAASQAITTGEVDPKIIAGAVAQAGVSSQILKPIIKDAKLNDKQAALVTNVVSSVITAASTGTDPVNAVNMAISGTAQQLFSEGVQELVDNGDLDRFIATFTASSDALAEVSDKIEPARLRVDVAAEKVDTRATELNNKIAEYNKARDYYNETGRFADEPTVNKLLIDLDKLEETLVAATAEYDSARADYDTASTAYVGLIEKQSKAVEDGSGAQIAIDDALIPINKVATRAVVDGLTSGEFNPEEYLEINGLTPDIDDLESDFVDPYEHWLDTGRTNLFSQKQYEDKLDKTLRSVLGDTIIENLDTKLNSIEDVDALIAAVKMQRQRVADGGIAATIDAANEYLDGIEARELPGDHTTSIEQDANVTDADIANGKAVATVSEVDGGRLGIVFKKEQELSTKFDPRINAEVTQTWDAEREEIIHKDSSGGILDWLSDFSLISSASASTLHDNPNIFWDAEDGSWRERNPDGSSALQVTIRPSSFEEVAKIAPVVAIDAADKFKLSAEDYAELDWTTRQFLDFSKNVSGAAKEYAVDNPDSAYAIKLAAGAALDAGGQLLNAFNGAVTFFRDSKDSPIDARGTNLGKVSKAIMDIGKATQPDEYNAAIKDIHEIIGKGKGFGGTLEAIYNGFNEAPLEFLVEFVGKEALQEIPLAIASGGAGLAVKGALGVAKVAERLARKWGSVTAWSTNAGLQVLETAGATAQETYAELYDKMISMGVDPEVAGDKAQEAAITNGVTAAIVEGTLGRVLSPGDILSRKIAGSSDVLFGTALEKIAKLGAGVVSEATSEAIEEGVTKYLLIGQHAEIDPTVLEPGGIYHDKVGAITKVAAMGAIAGGGTAASTQFGSVVYDAVKNGTYTGGDTGIPADYWTESQVMPSTNSPAANASIAFNPKINQAVNDTRSDDPAVSAAGTATIQEAFGYDPLTDFGPLTDFIDLTQDDDGVFRFNTAVDILNVGQPDKYTSTYEATAAFDTNTAGIPYVPTATDIQSFVGSKPQATLQADVDTLIDQNYTDAGEVAGEFKRLGYTPSKAEIDQKVGQGVETEQLSSIAPDIDSRQTTPDEVLEYFKSLGYNATKAEAALFAGQGGSDFQTTQLATIDTYVTPRRTTRKDVEGFFEAEGYKPSKAEVDRFIAQANDPEFRTKQEQKLITEFDPLAVKSSEVKKAYEEAGFFGALPSDIEHLTGQYAESDLSGRMREHLPIATYNSLVDMLGGGRSLEEQEQELAAYRAKQAEELETYRLEQGIKAGEREQELAAYRAKQAEDLEAYRLEQSADIFGLGTDINSIAEILGKTGQEVTQNDIDFVTDIIAQQEVMSEPTPFTPEQLQYDVNADNVIDIADQTMLEEIMAGTTQQTQVAPASQFAATGIQGQIQNQMQVQQQIQSQIQEQEAARQRRQAQQKQQAYMQQLLETTPVKVETPDPGKIEYVYDPFGESIFASPEQEALFVNPYTQAKAAAQGGIVNALRR